MAFKMGSLTSLIMLVLVMTSFSVSARTAPDEGRALTASETSRAVGSFDMAKMSDSAKILIRDCIDDSELSLSPRRCVNLIKSIMDSQKGALGASLMMKTCVRRTHSKRGCDNLVEKAISLSTKKSPASQTAYATQLGYDDSTAAR